jgi:hypothetical protein
MESHWRPPNTRHLQDVGGHYWLQLTNSKKTPPPPLLEDWDPTSDVDSYKYSLRIARVITKLLTVLSDHHGWGENTFLTFRENENFYERCHSFWKILSIFRENFSQKVFAKT